MEAHAHVTPPSSGSKGALLSSSPSSSGGGEMAAAPCFRFRPTRLCFPAGHRFFEEGDVQRHLHLRLLVAGPGWAPEEEEEPRGVVGPGLRCPSEGCRRSGPFPSLPSLEHHYAWAHRSACAACGGRPFPSGRLLELHLREKHDPLLPPRTTAATLPFQCLVEGCPEAFQSPSERREHLVAQHRYPEDFRFLEDEGPPRRGTGAKSTSAKARKAQSAHGGSSSARVVPMDVAQDQEEAPPAAIDAMEVVPSGRAEEHRDEEEVAAFPQVPHDVFVASEKPLYRPRLVPATVCFGQGAPPGL